jgi:hypothetical protein
VRNPDRAPHALDPVVPRTIDPFGDIAMSQASTILLTPGEACGVVVQFRPSRAGRVAQVFRFDSDRGMGPAAEVEVIGVGSDRMPARERIADRDYEAALAAPERDSFAKPRRFADTAVDEWAAEALARDALYAHWLQNNWTHFAGKTGGDIHYDGPSLLRKAVTHLAAKTIGRSIAPEVAAHPAASKVVEKAFGELTKFIYDKLSSEDAPSPEAAALEAGEKTAAMTIEKGNAIDAYRERADLEIRDTQSAAKERIARASSAPDLATWESWARNELAALPAQADLNDLSLAKDLLAQWVLERSASPTKASSDTNSTAWKAARAEVAHDGTLKTLERSDLFVHQCRHEWSRLGLAASEIDDAIAELERSHAALELEAGAQGASGEGTARWIERKLDDVSTIFKTSADWRRTSEGFAGVQYELGPDVDGYRVFRKGFVLLCSLWLKHEGAAVFVDHFSYSVAGYSDLVRTP